MRKIPGYTLVEKIHQSANSSVYRAKVEQGSRLGEPRKAQGRPVIVKIIEEACVTESACVRFSAYCDYQQQLQSPLINQVLEVIELADCCILVSEDIGGISLEAWLKLFEQQYVTNPLMEPSLFRSHLLLRIKWAIEIAEAIVA